MVTARADWQCYFRTWIHTSMLKDFFSQCQVPPAMILVGLVAVYFALFKALDGTMIIVPNVLSFLLAAVLIWLSLEDWLHQSFPLWALIIFVLLSGSMGILLTEAFWINVVAAVSFALGFLGIDLLFRQLRGTSVLGSGDAVMVAGIAALLGPLTTGHVILLASILGLAWALYQVFFRGFAGDKTIAFGPFLAVSTWCFFLEPELFL